MAATWRVEVLMPGDGADDPFRYGWRYVRRVDEHGAEMWDQVPLTLLDVLHPQEGDFIVQNDPHARRCNYLYDVLSAKLAADPTALVMHDVGVDWGVAGIRPHSPDIAVFLGVRERPGLGVFSTAEYGGRAALVIEVTSPTTAVLDRATKLEQYERVELPHYVLVDTIAGGAEAPPRLVGYRLIAGRYQTLPPDERGRLWLDPVGLWLGVADDEIVLYDESGQPQGDYTTLARELAAERQALAAKRQELAAERQAREQAEARLQALEAELRQLRGE
jgi:Uma2 family endonuclease